MDEQMIQKLSGELSKIILEAYEQGRKDALAEKADNTGVKEGIEEHCYISRSKLKKLCKQDARYSDFIIFEHPKVFSKIYEDLDLRWVRVYSTDTYEDTFTGMEHLVGYCGYFSWSDNKITPLDGDSYNPDMTVVGVKHGYRQYADVVCILVGNDW